MFTDNFYLTLTLFLQVAVQQQNSASSIWDIFQSI